MIIAILDYTTGEVIIRQVPEELEELDGDDLLSNMGYSISNTCYMVVDDALCIDINAQNFSGRMILT